MGIGGSAPSPARVAVLLLVAAGCTRPPAEAGSGGPAPHPGVSPAESVIRVAAEVPPSLDPRDLQSPDSLLLASQVFDGLVVLDPETLAAVPAVAERWEVLDEGRRFVFHLRQGATFHDGSPVRAQDFETAWNRLADPLAARPFSFLLEEVEGFDRYQEKVTVTGLSGVVARDDRTLEVTLVRPSVDFLALVAHPALSPVPPASAGSAYGAQPAGNGPYRLVAPLTPGTPVTLERFEGYYGLSPSVQTAEFRGFEDVQEGWPEFLSGNLEIAPIPGAVLAEARASFGDRGIVPLARLLYCGFDEGDPRFEDPAVRRAVSLALDRPGLAEEVLADLPQAAAGIVPPGIPGHVEDACGDDCVRDVEAARSLARRIPRKDRTFFLDYAASPVSDAIARALGAQLSEAGFRAIPRPHDATAYRDLLRDGGQDMFCLTWVADAPRQSAFLDPVLRSGSPDNVAGVDDPDIDELLDRADATLADRKREGIYGEAERLALEGMHVIPVLWFRSNLAVQPYVEGFTIDPLGQFDVAAMTLALPSPSPSPTLPSSPGGLPTGIPGIPSVPVPEASSAPPATPVEPGD